MAQPPPDDISVFVLVLGPAALLAIIAAFVYWLRSRSRRNGPG